MFTSPQWWELDWGTIIELLYVIHIYIYKGHVPPIMGFQWYDNIIGMLNEAAWYNSWDNDRACLGVQPA